jgi:hypothetical protein
MREALARLQYLEDVENERRAYARTPIRRAEKPPPRALQRSAAAAVTADGDDW